jgi:L-iditol 2-dehydrogenase
MSTSLKKNPALVVSADHQIRMQEAPVRQPGRGEALIHVRATGICGSDIHFWKHGQIGDLVVAGDCILGHEPAGEVIQVGEGVEGLEIGKFSWLFWINKARQAIVFELCV